MLVLTRALRSLTPAAVAAVRVRVRWGRLSFAVAAFTVAAFALLADAFPVPVASLRRL